MNAHARSCNQSSPGTDQLHFLNHHAGSHTVRVLPGLVGHMLHALEGEITNEGLSQSGVIEQVDYALSASSR